MPPERITYQNWIADLGRDPSQLRESIGTTGVIWWEGLSEETADDFESERRSRIRGAVEAALSKLSDNERELVEQFHYMGRSYSEIAERSGRAVHRLEAMHSRVLKKLRRALAPLVKELYGLKISTDPECPICSSPHRKEIDRLISDREQTETWRPIIRLLKTRFGISITTPQILIGHERFH